MFGKFMRNLKKDSNREYIDSLNKGLINFPELRKQFVPEDLPEEGDYSGWMGALDTPGKTITTEDILTTLKRYKGYDV
ncbi:hypothetical protein GF360_02430 [candidate division WWE3 bacterium]|nr:hypothetical protein [candidate division WWE3 bacterium]